LPLVLGDPGTALDAAFFDAAASISCCHNLQ
jgi:hypothetical protein